MLFLILFTFFLIHLSLNLFLFFHWTKFIFIIFFLDLRELWEHFLILKFFVF